MTAPEPSEQRFRYAHGLVYDQELVQSVPRRDDAHIAGVRVAALAAWTPMPRIIHIYRLPDGQHAWQWEPNPPGGQYAR